MTAADVARPRDMLGHARKALLLVENADPERVGDEERVLAMVACMIFVGEASANLTADLREKLTDVPWREAKLLRNMLVHRYFEINAEQLVATVVSDVPPLIAQLEQLLEEAPSP